MSAISTKQPRIVILGGGYAGLAAAARLSKLKDRVSITLIDAKLAFHERIRLHQAAAGQQLKVFHYREFLEPRGVEFIHAQATEIAPDASMLTLRHPNGAIATLAYDYLVYAPGSAMDVSAIEGVREYAHAFHSLDAAKGAHAALAKSKDSHVLVVGGGLTGIETAAELAESFPQMRVTLAIDKPFSPEIVPGGFSAKATDYLYQSFDRMRITVKTGSRVAQLRKGVAAMSNGKEISFDTCIWTSGFAPLPLASEAGIQVNKRGQIVTDAFLRSRSHSNIIAIGDAAQAEPRESGSCRMGCATGLAMATAGARTLTAILAAKALPEFRFVYLFRNICLGRQGGVIQFVDRRDVPRNIVWTGASAARWKEYVCRSTLSTIGLSTPDKLPEMPPLRMLPQLLRAPGQYA